MGPCRQIWHILQSVLPKFQRGGRNPQAVVRLLALTSARGLKEISSWRVERSYPSKILRAGSEDPSLLNSAHLAVPALIMVLGVCNNKATRQRANWAPWYLPIPIYANCPQQLFGSVGILVTNVTEVFDISCALVSGLQVDIDVSRPRISSLSQHVSRVAANVFFTFQLAVL